MSIASEISRLQTAKAELKTAIEGKGVTVPSSTKLDGYADLVESIQQGGGYEENVWYFCCGDFAKYLLTKNEGNNWWDSSDMTSIRAYGKLCWFEFNGEKYYVDSFSYGNHTLTKQGAPVSCNIHIFLNLQITQSGSDYIIYVAED